MEVIDPLEHLFAGRHDELIRRDGGAYAQLVHLQEVYDKDGPVAEAPQDPDYVPDVDEEAPVIVKRDSGLSGDSPRGAGFGESKKKLSSDDTTTKCMSEGPADEDSTPDDVEVGETSKAAKIKKKVGNVSIFRLAKLNRPEAPLFVVGTCAAAANGLVFPAFALLLSNAITAFYEVRHKLRKDINFWSLMFLLLAIFIGVCTPIQTATFAVIGSKLIRRVRSITLAKILRQEISWFDEEQNSRSDCALERLSI